MAVHGVVGGTGKRLEDIQITVGAKQMEKIGNMAT